MSKKEDMKVLGMPVRISLPLQNSRDLSTTQPLALGLAAVRCPNRNVQLASTLASNWIRDVFWAFGSRSVAQARAAMREKKHLPASCQGHKLTFLGTALHGRLLEYVNLPMPFLFGSGLSLQRPAQPQLRWRVVVNLTRC